MKPVRPRHAGVARWLGLWLLLWAGVAAALPTNNLEIVAVPAPGPVTIDGQLEDWDLSGSILSCADTAVFLPTAAVRSAAMYDADGLYLACRWVDPTPLASQVDPDEPGMHNQGWRSDCLQLRLRTDTQVHITAWQYQPTGKMMFDINYDQPVGPNRLNGLEHGVKMAFLRNADQSGYVQEIFIPWKLLSRAGKVYQAGDAFTFGFHFNWGGKDNKSARATEWQDPVSSPQANRTFYWNAPKAWGQLRLSPTGRLTLPRQPWDDTAAGPDLTTAGSVPLAYELAAAAAVTLVIEDEVGRRVRNLISGYPRAAGQNTDHWDGCDDRGEAVKPGTYRWRGLVCPPLDVRYRLHLYPAANPPWRNAEGTGGWGADHSAPTGATACGDRAYLLYHVAEGGSALIACDLNGNKLWGHGGALQGGGLVCTTDGKDLYYANEKAVTRIAAATGKALAFATGLAALPSGLPPNAHPTGIAFRGDRLYLACATRNVVRVFDLETDQAVKDLALPAPMGLAFDQAGSLLAVSGDTVVRLDPESGTAAPLIRNGLAQPGPLAVAPDGRILVGNGGTHQVLLYSADGQTVLGAIGRRGGRPAVGEWDREGLRDPIGIGMDGEGNIWVAEGDQAAKRLGKWSPAGKNLGEWLGPSPYNGDGVVDHRDRSRIYCGGVEFKADWGTGTSKPVFTHLRGPAAGQPGSAQIIAYGSFWHRQGFTTTYRGNDYFCFDRGLLCIRRGNAWVPCAAIGYVQDTGDGDRRLWSDRNEDGKVQADEVFDPAPHGLPWFSLTGGGGWGVPWSRHDLSTVRMTDPTTAVRFTPAEFTQGGVPIFDERSLATVKLPVPIKKREGPVDVDDNVMVAFYEDSHAPWMAELRQHPLGDLSGIKAFDRAGALLWSYPQPFSGVHGCFKAPLPTMPGQIIGTIYVMGVADLGEKVGRVLCFNGYYGQRFLMTTDGLFVGALFKDGRMLPNTPPKAVPDMSMNDMSPGGEAYAGTFSRNANGDVYLTSSFSGPMCVVMQVLGLDQVQRLAGGQVELTPELLAQGQARRAERQAAAQAATLPKVLTVAQLTPTIDGKLDDWGDLARRGVSIPAAQQRPAQAALAYDGQNLYAAFRVADTSPWRNATDDPQVLHIFGDAVDVQLGLDPNAGAGRAAPQAGDLRLVIGPFQGQPVVMLHQAVVPGSTAPKVPFVSPVGRVEFDRVARLAAARVAVQVTADGYVVEAAIPWAELGGKAPGAGAALRGDLGVLYSDTLGVDCVLRSYWANRQTGITSDLPAESRLTPSQWGQVLFE